MEKNSYRIACQAASAAAKTLDLTVAAYLVALQEQLNACRQLVSADAGVLEAIADDLTLLAEAANRLPKPDRPASIPPTSSTTPGRAE